MLAQFRSAGAAFLVRSSPVEIYFAAQHFGIPTRLLDWSTNPLAAPFPVWWRADARRGRLRGAREGDHAPGAMMTRKEKPYQAVRTTRHPFVEYAVSFSFWSKPKPDHLPRVLPVRSDIIPRPNGQQSSRFTLHMHGAPATSNDTLITILTDGPWKKAIRDELHRLNINHFTTYLRHPPPLG